MHHIPANLPSSEGSTLWRQGSRRRTCRVIGSKSWAVSSRCASPATSLSGQGVGTWGAARAAWRTGYPGRRPRPCWRSAGSSERRARALWPCWQRGRRDAPTWQWAARRRRAMRAAVSGDHDSAVGLSWCWASFYVRLFFIAIDRRRTSEADSPTGSNQSATRVSVSESEIVIRYIAKTEHVYMAYTLTIPSSVLYGTPATYPARHVGTPNPHGHGWWRQAHRDASLFMDWLPWGPGKGPHGKAKQRGNACDLYIIYCTVPLDPVGPMGTRWIWRWAAHLQDQVKG